MEKSALQLELEERLREWTTNTSSLREQLKHHHTEARKLRLLITNSEAHLAEVRHVLQRIENA